MKLIGLTGGIGMGKSAATNFLREWGIPVIDTDAIAHEIVEPGEPALEEVRRAFGEGVVDATGRLCRDRLAEIVFGDAVARRTLEEILHPRIRNVWREEARRWRSEAVGVGVVVIPLLYETGAAPEFDAAICVACSSESQRGRLRERGMNDEQMGRRIQAQWPVEEKARAADYVIWTDVPLEIHSAQLERVLQAIGAEV